jgi:hypothetical protein
MRQLGAAVLMALTAVLLWGAEGRRKLWDLDLSIFVNHQTDMASQVWGIRLSPDDMKVAIGFGPSWNLDPRPRHLVVVAVKQPQTALREFELNISGVLWRSGSSIVWSPSGRILVARTQTPVMFRLGQEAPCVFPKDSEFGGFLSEDRIVIHVKSSILDEPTNEIRILKSDCSLSDNWKMNGTARVLDTSPEQDLLAIATFPQPPEHLALELVAARTHDVKQRRIWDTGPIVGGGSLFSDQGKLVCGVNPREGKTLPGVACWDTQTGAKTVQAEKLGTDGVESAGGDLLSITDYRYISHPWWITVWTFRDSGGNFSVPQRRLIWNVRTGKEVASWGMGGLQQTELFTRSTKSASTIKTNFVLSLSPTGKYVAEGGSGSVSVYAVEP